MRTHLIEASSATNRTYPKGRSGVSTHFFFFFFWLLCLACAKLKQLGGSLGPSGALDEQAWKNRGWVGEEGVGNGGKEGKAEGLKKKHQVTVYIPLRSHVAQTQEQRLLLGSSAHQPLQFSCLNFLSVKKNTIVAE